MTQASRQPRDDEPGRSVRASEPSAPPPQATVPDPVTFLREAESATNAWDLDAVLSVYGPEATLESVTDGAREIHRGPAALRMAWTTYLGAFRAQRLQLSKRLVTAGSDTIVNEWSGDEAHKRARGIEFWRFSDRGEVVEHRLYTFLDTRPSSSPLARLRLGLTAPGLALSLLRAQGRAGREARLRR